MKMFKNVICTALFAVVGVVSVEAREANISRPICVYNNWSAYDELSDNIPLNEQLAMRELEQIVRLRKSGVRMDYYLMDAFWFDASSGYREWKKEHWPDGPARWLAACKANNLKPGLWFSTNLLQIGGSNTLKVIEPWRESLSADGKTMCLFHGGYLDHLMETLQIYADMGVEMFKFDFAYFDAAPEHIAKTMSREQIIERNQTAFIEALKRFREHNPEVMLIGYNGFGGDMENTVVDFRKSIDHRWLEVFDTMYCGDPRVSDVPMMNFWRSADLYSDHMVRQFEYNGLPLSRIDNCAFMIGTTGTCYNRGVNAWKGMFVLMMARGGWLNVYHGNLELLDRDDAKWFARSQKLFLELQQAGHISTFGDIPGHATGCYGYRAQTPKGVVYTVVNPTQSMQTVTLPCKPASARILFTDSGFIPKFADGTITLGAEQMAVIGVGHYGKAAYDMGVEPQIIIPESIEPVKFQTRTIDENSVKIVVEAMNDQTIRVLFRQLDEACKAFRSWGGAPPDGKKMDSYIKIEAMRGGKILPADVRYDKVVWCGLSWGVAEIRTGAGDASSPIEITCYSVEGRSDRFDISIYKLNYNAN